MRLFAFLFFVISPKIWSQQLPQMDSLILKNGLKIYLLCCGQDSTISLRLVINGGKKNESTCQVGYSEIIKELFKETIRDKRKAILKKNIKVKCEMVRGQLVLSSRSTTRDFERHMELFSTTILKLPFKPNKIDKVVSSVIETYRPEKITTSELARVYTDFLVYGFKNPLGRDYCQYQIQKVTPEELREFYFKYYTPKNTSLLISGNFNSEAVKKSIARYFNRWKTLRKDEDLVDEGDFKIPKIKSKEIIFINRRAANACLLKWIQLAPTANSTDYPAFLLVLDIFDSYMNEKMRLGLNRDTVNVRSHYTSCFRELDLLTSQSEMQATVNLFDLSLKNFYELKFDERAIEEYKEKLKNRFKENSSPEKTLSFYDPILYNFESRKSLVSKINSLTSWDLQKIQEKYFAPDAYKLIIIANENAGFDPFILSKKIPKYQAGDFQACNEKCVPVKNRWKPHNEQPRLFCRNCWKLGRFWGKNRS